MKKNILTLFTILILFSCSSSDDSTNSNSNSSSPYHPPVWIHGTWGLKANGVTILNDNPYYKFTSDNLCQLLNGTSSLCWKESIQQFPTLYSGSETITSNTYEANFISVNGPTLTLKFEKVSATKIKWIGTSSGDFLLDKLD